MLLLGLLNKQFITTLPSAVDVERRILVGNRYAPLASKVTNQEHGHQDILYLLEMKLHGALSLQIKTILIGKN